MDQAPPRRDIWVVDDSPTDLGRAKRTLEPRYQVRGFGDATSMIETLSTATVPDVLVVDWVMEGMTGLDVCTYIRGAPRPISDTPVLLLTAQGREDQVVEGLEAGASDYLIKPYGEAVLRARVASLVRQRELVERAERAEANVKRLLSSAPDALLSVNAQGKVTYANEEAGRICGAAPREMVGRSAGDLFPGLFTRTISVGPGEALLPLPDVQVGDRVFSPSYRILPSDTAASTTISLRDVTERRRAEVRRLDFYSIMAHDLRTPLSAMLLRTDMILRGKHGVLRPELSMDIRKIGDSARSLVAMVNDFLDLAKLEGTEYKIEREPIDLGPFVRAICEDFRPLLETNRLTWVDQSGSVMGRVLGDRRRLAQVVTNLVGNGIKFCSPGGELRTRVIETDEVVEVQIEDTGPGIDPEQAPKLFERYVRLDQGGGPGGARGTGLGLMIVREIIEAHRGEVGVDTRVGEGSTFWFRLRKAKGGEAPGSLRAPGGS